MAFQVKDLLFTLNPSAPIPMHLTCGPLSVDTQCPTASATQPRSEDRFDCAYTADTNCNPPSAALDVRDSGGDLQQLRRQLAEIRERGDISLN